MATKTISLRMEAYRKLRQARRYRGESFSEVVLRARWPETTVTGRELVEIYEREGPFLSDEGLEIVEELQATDPPPTDKWAP